MIADLQFHEDSVRIVLQDRTSQLHELIGRAFVRTNKAVCCVSG